MQKVVVIGCPGSGKSTFARKLHEKTGIPLHYLDMIWWREDKTTVTQEEFDVKLAKILNEDSWIIDGNYLRTLKRRICECDTVFFLDMPAKLCVHGIKERVGRKRDDMPWIEERVDEEFLQFVREFNSHTRPEVMRLLERCSDKKIVVFSTHAEINEYFTNKNTVS